MLLQIPACGIVLADDAGQMADYPSIIYGAKVFMRVLIFPIYDLFGGEWVHGRYDLLALILIINVAIYAFVIVAIGSSIPWIRKMMIHKQSKAQSL